MYSALHVFNSHTEDKPANTITNPSESQDLSPSAPSAFNSPLQDSVHRPDDSAWQEITNELKLTKDALFALQQRINNNEGKVSNLVSQFDVFQVIPFRMRLFFFK